MAQPGSKISQGLSYRELPNKAYQSTRAFNTGTGALYTYSTSLNGNFQTVGSLVVNTASSALNCPTGRVVHANGKVLIPGVHVGGGAGVNPATGSGSTTPATLPFPMVGVYDPVSGLNGYINPQDNTWAAYDATLSAFYDNTATPGTTLGGQGAEPRFGSVFVGSGTGNPSAVNIGGAHTGVITIGGTPGTTMVVSSSSIASSSIVMLTLGKTAGSTNAVTNASVTSITPGVSFTVSFFSGTSVLTAPAATDTLNFIIVN